MKSRVLALAFAAVIIGMWAASRAAAQEPPDHIVCTGVVVDGQNNPVQGAEVAAYHFFWWDPLPAPLEAIGPIVKTGADGAFTLDMGEIREQVLIVTQRAGLAMDWVGYDMLLGREHFTLQLLAPSEFAGVVVDDMGKPVAGATVQAFLAPKPGCDNSMYVCGPGDWLTTRTDAIGAFRLRNIPPWASAGFRVTPPGGATIFLYRNVYTRHKEHEAGDTSIRLALPPLGRVQGRVVDAVSGEPAAGVPVLLAHEDRPLKSCAQTVTDPDGRFAFEGLLGEPYELTSAPSANGPAPWAFLPSIVRPQPDKTVSGVTIKAGKGGLVRVLVRDAVTHRPLPGAMVFLQRPSRFGIWFTALGSTAPDGVLVFRAMLGPQTLRAVGSGLPYEGTADADQHINVVAGQTIQCTISLPPWPRVTGAVLDDNGRPAPDAEIGIHFYAGGLVLANEKGEYEIRFRTDDGGGYLIARVPRRGLVGWKFIDPGTRQKDLVLSRGIVVTGRVRDKDGAAIRNASVSLDVRRPKSACLQRDTVRTDAQGIFEIPAVLPPDPQTAYLVQEASAPGYGKVLYRKILLTGAPGDHVAAPDIVLVKADTSAAGVVLDKAGRPAPNVIVFLTSSNGSSSDQVDECTTTDEQGRFRFEHVCKRPLRIQAGFRSQGGGYRQAMGGDQDIVVRLGDEREVTPSSTSSPSLAKPAPFLKGKPLPTLDGFTFTPPPPAMEGKKIMVCFWDVKQRTARHALETIAAKAEDLQKSGVVVLIVHAPASDRKPIDDWMNGAKVIFPLSVLPAGKGAGDKLLKDWGVQSLPWIVITDEKHVVVAEGFEGIDLRQTSSPTK